MDNLIEKRVIVTDITGWSFIGTLIGIDKKSITKRWVLNNAFKMIYTYEDNSSKHDWIEIGAISLLDSAIISIYENKHLKELSEF